MYEIIAYSCVIILLPIIPAYILYTAIPAQEGSVEGEYQGLNIKLKGAFAGYFILALLLTSFIGARLMTESDYEYWTVEGVLDVNNVGEPHLISFSIEPPDQQVYADGRFVINNVPIRKGKDKRSTLVLAKMSEGGRLDEVVHLEEEKRAFEAAKKYKVEFNKNGVISIHTPISFADVAQPDSSWGSYSSDVIPEPLPATGNGG